MSLILKQSINLKIYQPKLILILILIKNLLFEPKTRKIYVTAFNMEFKP